MKNDTFDFGKNKQLTLIRRNACSTLEIWNKKNDRMLGTLETGTSKLHFTLEKLASVMADRLEYMEKA